MRAFGIIADDLTGACDAGGAFAAAGHRVAVDLCRDDVPELGEADVMVVDAGVRDAASEDVRPAVERALARLEAAGADLRMLKIDSTLRGPVSAMLEALLDMGGIRTAVVAPAFPEQGRRLVEGRLEVHGVDAGADLRAMVEEMSARVRLVSSESLPAAIGAISGDADRERHVVIVDGEAASDLEATARALVDEPTQVLLLGSAGLARQVAKVWRRGHGVPVVPAAPRAQHSEETWFLVVAGSPAEATLRQLDVLVQEMGCEVHVVTPGGGLRDVVPAGDVRVFDSASAFDPVGDVPAAGDPRPGHGSKVMVLRTPPGTVRDQGQAATALASTVSSMVANASDDTRRRPMGLVLVGGDTSARVLAALAVDALDVRGEVEVGMPVTELRGGPWDGVMAITKAGGFGGERALVSAVEFLARVTSKGSPGSSELVRAGSRSA